MQIPDDERLLRCNETEILELARKQGYGRLRKGLSLPVISELVAGEQLMYPEYLSGIAYTRQKLEGFIHLHWGRVKSQLPGCDGKCTTFHCSDGKHALCFLPNEGSVR